MKKYLSHLSIVTLILVTFGCGNFGNTDVNPNGSTVPYTPALLTSSLTNLGLSQLGGGESSNYLYPSYYCQYMSQALYTDASRYAIVDPGWGLYATRVEDLQNIIDVNTNPATAAKAVVGGSNNNQIAIARILKAYWMSYITDRFGDVPYTEAFKGKANPKYDTQQSIYLDLLKELKEAAAQFDGGATVKGDILFNGDATKWTKFANSWRIILAVRLSKIDPATGKSNVQDVVNNLSSNGGVFTTSADDATLVYPGSGAGFQNPWLSIGADQVVCSTLANWVTSTSDNRRFAFGDTIKTSKALLGMPPGLTRADALNYTSNNPNQSLVLNKVYKKDVAPLVVLCSGDVLLARAEAAMLGWTSDDVNTMYTAGITQSWNRWGLKTVDASNNPNSDLAAYFANGDVKLGATSSYSDAEKIGIQRWLSFYPNGDQGWAELRRTGYPSFVKPVSNSLSSSGNIPSRYIYPTSEHGLNPDNWAAASALLDGGDSRDSHVWWDK